MVAPVPPTLTKIVKNPLAVMKGNGVVVHELHWLVTKNDPAKLLGNDGTHYTKEANALLTREYRKGFEIPSHT